MYSLARLFLIVGFLGCCYADSFTFCKLSDSDADFCLAHSIENALHMLKTDAGEYDLESMDPYVVEAITIDAGSGPLRLTQYYKNVKLFGLSDAKITKAHYDADKKWLSIEALFPKITQQSDYHVDGKIMTLPVVGHGKSTLILENTKINMDLQFQETQKGGLTYFKIKHLTLDINPKKFRLYFEDLFDGNKLLGDNINRLINEEWEALYMDVKPAIDKSYGEIFRIYAQEFFDHVPAEEIFLE